MYSYFHILSQVSLCSLGQELVKIASEEGWVGIADVAVHLRVAMDFT